MKKLLIFIGLMTAILLSLHAQEYTFKADVSGKGDPILFIPGLGCSGAVWDETLENLAGTYESHVVTLPGFAGQAPIESESYLETVGDELISYMEAKELDDVVIVGHSLGGFLALYIGAKVPELASKLIVVDGLPFLGSIQNPSATPETMKEMAENMRKNMEVQTSEQYEATQPMMLRSMMNSEDDIATVMEWGRQSDPKTVAQAMYELYQIDLRGELSKITAPTLVLGAWIAYQNFGATRESTMKLYEAQFQNMADYQLELTDKGKHFIMWDDPEFFMEQITTFMEKKS